MTCTNVLDRAIGTRSEEDIDTTTTAIKALGAGLVLVHLHLPTPAQVLPVAGMILLRIPRAADTTVAEVVAVSGTKQIESPPANETIVKLTPRVRLLAHDLLWTLGMIEVVIRL